jgi:hypothetical protein
MSRLPSSPPPSFSSPHVDLTADAPPSPSTPLRPTTRKLKIKKLTIAPNSVPQAYFQQTHNKLENAVTTILSEGKLDDSLEELYRSVENLVRENRGGKLYVMLQERCRSFIAGAVMKRVDQGCAGSIGVGGDAGIGAVECIDGAWAKWTSQLVWIQETSLTQGLIRSIFYDLDRTYVFKNPKLSSIT